MQCGTTNPAYRDAGLCDGICGQPKIAYGDQTLARIHQRQTIAHPRDDTLLLK